MLYPVIVAIVAIAISAVTRSPDAFGLILGLGIVLPIALYLIALVVGVVQRRSKRRD